MACSGLTPSTMGVCRHFAIGIRDEGHTLGPNSLFSALAALFPVEFRTWTDGDCHGLDALILSGQEPASLGAVARFGLPVFAALPPSLTQASTRPSEFFLEQSPTLSPSLRGLHFEDEECAAAAALNAVDGDDVVASQRGEAVWLRRRMERADVTMVSWPLPYFGREDHIYENFRSGRFLRLLPLLQFLRNLTGGADWQSPPTPACLLVDDPNLHTNTYGYLDFRWLADESRRCGFYAAIATVPLDCWWLDRETTELFRENAPRISILPHGNNHTWEELAQPASDVESLSLLAQALRRCRRLEQQQAAVELCRVMECPHGSLSVAMLEPMARLGYEAVFASTDHLLRCNQGTDFPASLGAERTLLDGKAVPIVPRIHASAGWQTAVRLAAFLKQPIILAVHHWDFAGQNQVAEEFAHIVNSLPDVNWASPTGVARACYQFREVGDVLHLRLGSRLVDVSIPDGIREVVIHRPWLQRSEESERLVLRAGKEELFRAETSADVVGPIAVPAGFRLQVASALLNAVDCNSVPAPRRRLWPLVRKLMVEIRDRSCVRVPLQQRQSETRKRHVAAEVG